MNKFFRFHVLKNFYFIFKTYPAWEIENRNSPSFRPGFQGRPPTGPMLGPGGNRPDWEHSPPPDAPFAHRMRPPFRPPTGPAGSSVNSPSSDREEERGGDRSASGSVERSHVCNFIISLIRNMFN